MNALEAVRQSRDAITVRRVYGDPHQEQGVTVIPAAAVMGVGLYQFDLIQNGMRVPRSARFTFVVVKRGADWRIAHHHSSATPPAPYQ